MNASGHQVHQLLGRLGDSERQLQLALEAADLGTWNWDLRAGSLVWSERFRELIGAEADQPVTPDAFTLLVYPDDRSALRQAVDLAVESAGAFSLEFRIVRPTGELRWLHLIGSAHPVGRESGASAMSGILRDVTEAHRAAETVLRQRRYLEQLLQMAPVGVAKFDRQMHFIALNPRFSASLRIRESDLVGRNLYQVLPDMPTRLRELYRRSLTGTPVRLEREPFARADGSFDEIDGQVLPWYDERGDVGGTTVILGTVTTHAAAPGTPEPSSTGAGLPLDVRMRRVADGASVGLVVSSDTGTIHYANPAWLSLAGMSEERALESNLMALIHPEDRTRVLTDWQELVHGAHCELEFRLLRPGREMCRIQCHTTLLHETAGASAGLVHTCEDLTERVQERAALDRLQLQIRALTRRLHELRRSERAELAARLQGELPGPLAALQERLAEQEHIHPEVGADADESPGAAALSCSAQAAEMIERLSGLQLELNPPRLEELGFAEVLTRFVGDFAERNGLEFELELPDTPLPAPSRLSAVLYEVAQEALNNISRHARASRVDVRVRIDDGQLRMRVQDDGVGLREADRRKPGRLGLQAAAAQLSEFGGTLQVAGVPGQGTVVAACVPFELPARPRLRLCD